MFYITSWGITQAICGSLNYDCNKMIKTSKTNVRKKIKSLKQRLYIHRVPIILSVIILLSLTLFIPFPRQETLTQEVQFSTENRDDASIELGKQEIKTSGATGKKTVTYRYNQSLFDILLGDNSVVKQQVSEEIIQAPVTEIIAKGTKKADKPITPVATETIPSNTTTNNSVDCSKVYYENTKVYQEFWNYHSNTVNGYIADINKQDHLTPDEKKKQINKWVGYFNDRVDELVATWKKSMKDSGCGNTPLGFSPGYMPIEE